MKAAILLTCCLIVCVIHALPIQAADPRPDNRVTVSVGDYRVELREQGAWTFGCMYYGDVRIGGDNGWYGLVLRRPKGGWIGTGHTEGGTEKVEQARLVIDGRDVSLAAKATYRGKHARLEKRSRVDNLSLHAVYDITPDGITEMHAIEAIEDQPVVTLYAFMHAWRPTTKQWMAEGEGGKILKGDLVSHNPKVRGNHWPLMNDVRWTAVYDPTAKLDIVL